MDPKKVFTFCPKCGGELAASDSNYLACRKCSYKLYINPIPCNGVIIQNDKGEILLVKRKYDPHKGDWDLPGGFIEINESFEESVMREIKEELGVDIKIDKIIGVYPDVYPYQSVLTSTLTIIVTAKIKRGILQPSDEITGYQFFPTNGILNQNLAFENMRLAFKDYLQ